MMECPINYTLEEGKCFKNQKTCPLNFELKNETCKKIVCPKDYNLKDGKCVKHKCSSIKAHIPNTWCESSCFNADGSITAACDPKTPIAHRYCKCVKQFLVNDKVNKSGIHDKNMSCPLN